MSEEEAEVGILLHYRAFRRGDAELVTRDYEQLTGEQAPQVGLSVSVATGSASPSQSNDSGTRSGAPSDQALDTQTSTSWPSRCSVSRRR